MLFLPKTGNHYLSPLEDALLPGEGEAGRGL